MSLDMPLLLVLKPPLESLAQFEEKIKNLSTPCEVKAYPTMREWPKGAESGLPFL